MSCKCTHCSQSLSSFVLRRNGQTYTSKVCVDIASVINGNIFHSRDVEGGIEFELTNLAVTNDGYVRAARNHNEVIFVNQQGPCCLRAFSMIGSTRKELVICRRTK